MDKLILKSQKREIHDCIINTRLEPSMFEWDATGSKYAILDVSRLKYIGTNYFFIFDFLRDEYYCTYSPGFQTPIRETRSADWNSQIDRVREWLKNLKREVEITDPWDDIGKYLPEKEEINLEDEKENSPFSYETVEHITNALHKLKDEIKKSYNLDTEQDKLVQEKLDYLIDCSKRMGRKDWYHIVIGAVIGLALKLDFTSEQAKGLWGLIKVCLKGIGLLEGSESV
jgi:hypothetical protein